MSEFGGEMPVEYSEPRLVPRYAFGVDVELTDVRTGSQISARTKDLSLFGCGVETLKPLPKETGVGIKLFHGGDCVAALGRVVYGTPELGMGIAFTSVERELERIFEG